MARGDLVFKGISFTPGQLRTLRRLLEDPRRSQRAILAEAEKISIHTAKNRLDVLRQQTQSANIDELRAWLWRHRDALLAALSEDSTTKSASALADDDRSISKEEQDWQNLSDHYAGLRYSLWQLINGFYRTVGSHAYYLGWDNPHTEELEPPDPRIQPEETLYRVAKFKARDEPELGRARRLDNARIGRVIVGLTSYAGFLGLRLPLTSIETSMIRSADMSTEHDEIAEFLSVLQASEEGRALVAKWREWLFSCPDRQECEGKCGPHRALSDLAVMYNVVNKLCIVLSRGAGQPNRHDGWLASDMRVTRKPFRLIMPDPFDVLGRGARPSPP